ncbi:MAG TPA: hypothetical protein VNW73_03180, partial [Ktedonobacteraceae bacterium]|nr:hypothetical protein [Ktedonobacteraceae bacterium]
FLPNGLFRLFQAGERMCFIKIAGEPHSNESLSTLIFEHSDYPSPSLQIFPKNTAHFERYVSDIIDKK